MVHLLRSTLGSHSKLHAGQHAWDVEFTQNPLGTQLCQDFRDSDRSTIGLVGLAHQHTFHSSEASCSLTFHITVHNVQHHSVQQGKTIVTFDKRQQHLHGPPTRASSCSIAACYHQTLEPLDVGDDESLLLVLLCHCHLLAFWMQSLQLFHHCWLCVQLVFTSDHSRGSSECSVHPSGSVPHQLHRFGNFPFVCILLWLLVLHYLVSPVFGSSVSHRVVISL